MMMLVAIGAFFIIFFFSSSLAATVYGFIIGLPVLAILGIVLWAIVRKKIRILALCFLIGGLAPGAYLLIMTRGCGLLDF